MQINTTTDHSFGPPKPQGLELSTTSGQYYTPYKFFLRINLGI